MILSISKTNRHAIGVKYDLRPARLSGDREGLVADDAAAARIGMDERSSDRERCSTIDALDGLKTIGLSRSGNVDDVDFVSSTQSRS